MHQLKEKPTSVLCKKMLDNCWEPFCGSVLVHPLGVGSPVLGLTDFMLLDCMLLLLNTWCTVPHWSIRSRIAHCDAWLTLLTGMH